MQRTDQRGKEAATLGWGWGGMVAGLMQAQRTLQGQDSLDFRPCWLGQEGSEPQLDKGTLSGLSG